MHQTYGHLHGISTCIRLVISYMNKIYASTVSTLKSIAWTRELPDTKEFVDPTSADFREEERFSNPYQIINELERKINMLQVKSYAMPKEREELLKAVVCRVDALEAELISTKKALHEALLRQDELLACVDSQEAAMSLGKKKRWCTRKSLK
ncbi:phosphatidylinositol/phosphatidylcholine transfer protein SFH6 [Daucus carota subsp. sativus]|nr:PREDICTED: phosphatidylinositol/phosphatidylcholine transfer protein SFH6-like [Daucus carota subsp. sativus]